MQHAAPQGTVTFLFTDLEGSTRLWERHGQAMGAVIARHDDLLRDIVESNAGYVVERTGDGVLAAFAGAAAGLQAAVAVQRRFRKEDWGPIGPLKVRAALHTASVEFKHNAYFGPGLSRAARIMAAGHGGQILVSLATQERLGSALPQGVTLRPMGERRLKDLTRSEQLFQVCAPDLPDQFPPLKTLDSRMNNLPAQANAFIGREEELARTRELLRGRQVRLLTLTGPGGVGKTRFGLQLAADCIDDFDDGVFFVELGPISEPDLVVPAIARALGLPDLGGVKAYDQLAYYLRERAALLVLDNFEQVLPAATEVGKILAACPRMKMLITSRSALRVYGENEFSVPTLKLPDTRSVEGPERLNQYESVRFFIERAEAAGGHIELTPENARAVVDICHRLDGLPLALELAAARTKIYAPAGLLARLEHRLAILKSGARDLPARQQTLREAIGWSYDLLRPAEQRLFARLGVLVGGFDFKVAAAICDPDGSLSPDFEDAIAGLVDHSLLRKQDSDGGEPRFAMLETIRELALDRLSAAGERQIMERRHATHFFELAAEAAPHLLYGSQRGAWISRLFPEADNVRAAFRWALTVDEAAPALQALWDLWPWIWALSFREGRGWVEQLIALPTATRSPALASAFTAAAAFSWAMEDWDASRRYATEAVEMSTALGDRRRLAWAKMLDGWWRTPIHGDPAPAAYDESRALFEELGDDAGVAWGYVSAACSAAEVGNMPLTLHLSQEALRRTRPTNDAWLSAVATFWMALLKTHGGSAEQARQHWSECLPVFEAIRDLRFFGIGHACLAQLARREGRADEAAWHYRKALVAARDSGNATDVPINLEGLAHTAILIGNASRAARLLGAAEMARRKGTTAFFPGYDELFAETLQMLEALAPQANNPQRDEGRAMTDAQAFVYALSSEG
jgi:predicted ATPase/class 3 adenylate cyclase